MLIYENSIDFTFREAGHLYEVRHRVGGQWTAPQEVEGTTSVLKVINKPALMFYPMNKALEYLQELKAKPTSKDFIQAKRAHVEHSNAGKQAGKVGHALVEALAHGKEVIMPTDPELKKIAESIQSAYRAFLEDFKPVDLEIEAPFYSKTHGFAGTLDRLCEIDGKKVILDFKTTNTSRFNADGIYPEYFAQLGGYSLGFTEMTGIEADDLAIVNLPKDGQGYKIKFLSDMRLGKAHAELFFLHALMLHRSSKQFIWKMAGN